jgi:F-type H+-transporting ATPase subunit b
VEADKVIASAKAEIDQEAERAKQHLRERVAELAVAGAEKILRREVNATAHADMLSALKQEL